MANRQIDVNDENYEAPVLVQNYIDKFKKAQLSDHSLRQHTKESLDWFRRRVSKDMKHSRYTMLRESGSYKRRTGLEGRATLVGRLFYFAYEAVEAGDRLNNVYDQYPMTFVFNVSESANGDKLMHGLNVHYLTPKEKAVLFVKLSTIRNKKGWTNATKLKISWDIIKAIVGHKIYEKAVHTYRADRFQSKLIEIHPEHWEIATFLQLSKFVSIDGSAVKQAAIRASHRKR